MMAIKGFQKRLYKTFQTPLIFALSIFFSLISVNISHAAPLQIIAFGDSLMAGYEISQMDAYPAKLQKALLEKDYDVKIDNSSVSGDTTSGGLSRLDWSIPDGTDGVILGLGANDALRGLPVQTTRDNLFAIVERLQERGIKVMLMGMLAPPNMGADYEAEFNKIYPDLKNAFDLPLYPFLLDGVAANGDLQIGDGKHPNGAGTAVMVEKSLPIIENFIQSFSE